MNGILTIPRPGDKIIVIDTDLKKYHNNEWIVLPKPTCGKFFGPHGFDIIWIGPESGPNWPDKNTRIFLRPSQYRII